MEPDWQKLLALLFLLVGSTSVQSDSSEEEDNDKVDGKWTEWFNTPGKCSVTCGEGTRIVSQTRTCDNPPPKNGGQECKGLETNHFTESCNEAVCPESDVANLCEGCEFKNGIGYNPYPGYCGKFIQCLNFGGSFQVQYCPFNTGWNQIDLTCNLPCDNPHPIEELCLLEPVPGDNTKYIQTHPFLPPVTLPCALGTVFDEQECVCVSGVNPADPTCTEEVYLSFDSGFDDESGNQFHIQNENVVRPGGAAYASFSSNSGIRIFRFSNTEFGNTLEISFLFTPGGTTTLGQAIVSNSDCGDEGSIYIIQKSSVIEFRVKNTNGDLYTLSVPFTTLVPHRSSRTGPAIPVSLCIDQNTMTAKVGINTVTKSFTGDIARSQCALQIGRGTGFDNFVGDLDEFRVFLCKP